jgi:hypothetical protein
VAMNNISHKARRFAFIMYNFRNMLVIKVIETETASLEESSMLVRSDPRDRSPIDKLHILFSASRLDLPRLASQPQDYGLPIR